MILLNIPTPATTSDFINCLRQLLAQAITVSDQTVAATGQFPAIDTLTINLTNATPLDHPAARWSSEPGEVHGQINVANLQVLGDPFGSGARQVQIEAAASNCRAQIVRLPGNQTALRLATAQNGSLRASVTRANVEAILLTEATNAAKAQGVEIKDAEISWRTDDPRTLFAEVLIKAKKGFLPTANLRVRGQLKIDDSLNSTISNLSVDGEGMVGSIGAGLIRPKLMKAEGMTRSLLALPLDALRITDVRLVASADALAVEATFEG
jgi:hypothetical protein